MTMKANILFTINRPSHLETTRIMCAPEDVNDVLFYCTEILDNNEKAWKITIEPTDIDYFQGELPHDS